MTVYFIGEDRGFVKIGYTDRLKKRFAMMRMYSPCELTVLRLCPGGELTEKWFHAHFHEHRQRGEWFRFQEEMLTVVPPDETDLLRPAAQIEEDKKTIARFRADAHKLVDKMSDVALLNFLGSNRRKKQKD